MAKTEAYKHVRIDPETGAKNYYFPMEITNEYLRIDAEREGLEICRTRLGFRKFYAVMIPCKDFIIDDGKTIYIPTPEEKQRRRYLDLIKDEMREQSRIKSDGRCMIPNEKGCLVQCPFRVPNPEYTPDNGEPKTLPVKCEGCRNEEFKPAHTVIPMSCLDYQNEKGETQYFEPANPEEYFNAEQLARLSEEFIEFVAQRKPELVELAKLKLAGYSRLECAKLLGEAKSTTGDHVAKLKKLVTEFLDA